MIYLSFFFTLIFVLYLSLQLTYIYSSFKVTQSANHIIDEKKISVLIPAYNEVLVLVQCLESWQRLDYQNKEAIFINDGSTDNTMHVLHELLELSPVIKETTSNNSSIEVSTLYQSIKFPQIFVVDQPNRGKSAALNTGISLATGEIIITLDADSILETDSLTKINESFANPKVIAAGGMVQVGQLINRRGDNIYGKNWIIKYQLSGYLSSFYVRKVTQAKLNVLGVVSGAFGAFRTTILKQIGGYKETLGEDMEITFRLQKFIHERKLEEKLIFIPEAVCYTEVPEDFKSLLHQRIRWQKGFLDCINLHKKEFFTKLSKRFSFFLLFESIVLSTLGITTLLLLPLSIYLGNVSLFTIILLATAWSSEFILRLVAFQRAGHYEYTFSAKQWFKIVLFTIWESVTYRLLDTFFFFYGTLLYFFGNNSKWHKLERSGSVQIVPMQEKNLQYNSASFTNRV